VNQVQVYVFQLQVLQRLRQAVAHVIRTAPIVPQLAGDEHPVPGGGAARERLAQRRANLRLVRVRRGTVDVLVS
jgi:hypothetical protein